jgi:hypothetical protein
MIEVRNLMFQPLTLHLAGDAGGIHLGSRERAAIPDGQISDEIQAAAARGYVSLEHRSQMSEVRCPTSDPGPRTSAKRRRER